MERNHNRKNGGQSPILPAYRGESEPLPIPVAGTHLLGEDKAAQKPRALFGGQRVEDAIEDELGEEQLVPRTNLARHATLHVHDVRGSGEAEPAQDALAALELFHLEHVVGRLYTLLELTYPRLVFLLPRVERVEFR